MRSLLAGIFLLLALGSSALGQATGFVKGLGFQNNFRPDSWTPLLVHLESAAEKSDDYQIQVHQQDMDRDLVVYTKTVTLGAGARQDYWVYFIPEPVGVGSGSLPASANELARVLKVYLYDKSGSKQIATLPVAFPANNIDGKITASPGVRGRGLRMVLAVVGDRSKPAWGEYGEAVGVMEDVFFVPVKTSDLPDNVLGYDAVDAVVWMDANAQDLTIGGGTGIEALKQYVARGGTLAVIQSPEPFDRLNPLADLLPIVPRDDTGAWAIKMETLPVLKPLVELARGNNQSITDSWGAIEAMKGQWDYARAQPRKDAVVEKWIDWPASADGKQPAGRSPYLARRSYELGSVSWLAQDIGNAVLHSAPRPPGPMVKPGDQVFSTGWPRVWDRVLGWSNDSRSKPEWKNEPSKAIQEYYDEGAGPVRDLGRTLLHGMEHGSRGAVLITVAIFFFIGYWIVAGPGSYLFLAARGKKSWSWVAFGAAALGATALTVGVVKLALRGSPEIKHFSVVRMTPADPLPDGTPRFSAVVRSRIGLYIPRDGDMRITLTDNTPGRMSRVTPLAIHPQFVDAKSAGFPNQARYVVNTDQFTAGKPISTEFPFRSTLKKLEADWTGTVGEGIVGKVQIRPPGTMIPNPNFDSSKQPHFRDNPREIKGEDLFGKLTNSTGRDLRNIYIGYQSLGENIDPLNVPAYVLYLPLWRKGQQIDLEAELAGAFKLSGEETPGTPLSVRKSIKAMLSNTARGGMINTWADYWFKNASRGFTDNLELDDSEAEYITSVPLLTFYDRIRPDVNNKNESRERKEILRRGGRDMNLSPALAAGKLVILAQALDGPLPLPLEVEGDKIRGEGTTIYQVVLPLDRSIMLAPPSTQPAQ